MINSLGWQVDTAESGEAAVALLKNRAKNGQLPFQAMFIDWQMPDKDGWQTIQELHAESTTQEPPITIMVSAQGRELLGQRSPEEHARLHGFLMKPVTASMLFDAVSDALASRSAPAPELVLQETVKPLQGLRLLVVEDNLINQQIAMEMLSNEGADVTLADNGQLGVDAVFQASLSDHPFDAVLMDIQMPVMDGYSATRMLREDASLTSLPIIAMTANAMASDREACLAAGMNEHVGKPFNLKQLVSLLQKLTQTDIAPVGSPTPTHSTPHEPPLPPTDALDVGAALERLGGNEALYAQVLTTFLNDLATQPAKLTHCLQQADYNGATRLLHTLKGLAATVGASYLAAVARKAELTLKTSTRAHAETGTLTLDQKTLCRDIEAAVITTQNILGKLARRYAAPLSAPTMADTSGDISGADLAQLNQLQTFLKASNMQATTVFEQILSRGTLVERPDFQRLRSAMAAFDFQEAVSACEHLVQGADK
jgi:two-component system sensor histidine kinase/response regulator